MLRSHPREPDCRRAERSGRERASRGSAEAQLPATREVAGESCAKGIRLGVRTSRTGRSIPRAQNAGPAARSVPLIGPERKWQPRRAQKTVWRFVSRPPTRGDRDPPWCRSRRGRTACLKIEPCFAFAIATLQTACLAVIHKLDTFANGYFTAALLCTDADADLDCEQNVYW